MTEEPSEVVNPSSADDKDIKIANLERELYMIKQQYDDSQQRIESFIDENAKLREKIGASEKAVSDKNDLYLRVDKERESLTNERAELQSQLNELKSKTVLAESDLERALNEKRHLVDESDNLRNELKRLREKNKELQTSFDQYQFDKSSMDSERNRWNQEKDLYIKNKEWSMKEIADRDQQISELRVQLLNIERQMIDERNNSAEEARKLNIQVESLGASVSLYEEEAVKLRTKVQSLISERDSVSNSMRDELETKEKLVETYQERIQGLEEDVKSLKNDHNELNQILKDKEEALANLHEETKKISDESSRQLAERDLKIIHLQDELDKANELLQYSGGRLGLSATADLSTISPSAAAAAELVSSGLSLTSMYSKHCKVISELHEERKLRKQLEEYVDNMVEEFRKKAPNVIQLRNEYEIAVTENEELRRRLNEYYTEKDELHSEKLKLERELSFTRGDFIAAQRENVELKKQVQRFLFHMEHANDDLEVRNPTEDASSFVTITQLHDRYMDVFNQIEELKKSHDEIVEQSRKEAAEELRPQIDRLSREVDELQSKQIKLNSTINELENERDELSDELEKLKSEPLNRSKIMDTEAVQEWKSKFETAQSKLDHVMQEKKIVEDTLQSRTEHYTNLISELKSLNAKLESNLEFQKKNHELAVKKVTEYEKEVLKKAEEASRYKVMVDSLESRVNDLQRQHNSSLDEVSRLKLSLHNASDELLRAQQNVTHLQAEVNTLKETNTTGATLSTTLSTLDAILKAHEDNSTGKIKSQLEEVTRERDDLRLTVEELRVHESSNADMARLKGLELDREKNKTAELESRLSQLNRERDELVKKLESVPTQVGNVDTLNANLQSARNQAAYLNKQLGAKQLELDELKQKLEVKESELEEMKKFSNNLEASLMKKENATQSQQSLQSQEAPVSGDVVPKQAFDELQQKFNAVTAEYEQLKSRSVQIKQVARNHRDNAKKFEEENTQLSTENEKLKSELKKMESDIKGNPAAAILTLRSRVAKQHEEISQMTKEKEELNKQITTITRTLEEKEIEIQQNKENLSRFNTIQSMFKKNQEALAKARQELQDANEKNNSLQVKYDRLLKQIEETESAMPPTQNIPDESVARKRALPEASDSPAAHSGNGKRPRIVYNAGEQDRNVTESAQEYDQGEVGRENEEGLGEDNEQLGDNIDKVPSMDVIQEENDVDQPDNQQEDDEMVDDIPNDENLPYDQQQQHMEYYGGQEGDSYSEPPQIINESSVDQYDQDNSGLPYLNEVENEEFYEDDDDDDEGAVEDDDGDEDIHSPEPDEGDDFGNDETGPADDDDIVILD